MGKTSRPVPENTAYATGYHDHYVRLDGERCRLTSFDPFNTSPAGDGPDGREAEIARWPTADVPAELLGAQFDIATLLAKLEQLRDALWMSMRNMLQAEHEAYEAERNAQSGRLAELLAVSRLDAAALARRNQVLAAAVALFEREHCGRRA